MPGPGVESDLVPSPWVLSDFSFWGSPGMAPELPQGGSSLPVFETVCLAVGDRGGCASVSVGGH